MDFDEDFRARLRDLLAWRRDVRRFRAEPLPPGTLDRLIEVACLAPSVGLSQPWRFVIVESPDRRRAVRDDFTACNAAALASQPFSVEEVRTGHVRRRPAAAEPVEGVAVELLGGVALAEECR